MVCNIHPIERVVRGMVGVGLIALVFVGPKSLWGLVGIVPLLTAVTGFCLPYHWLGINTARMGKK